MTLPAMTKYMKRERITLFLQFLTFLVICSSSADKFLLIYCSSDSLHFSPSSCFYLQTLKWDYFVAKIYVSAWIMLHMLVNHSQYFMYYWRDFYQKFEPLWIYYHIRGVGRRTKILIFNTAAIFHKLFNEWK